MGSTIHGVDVVGEAEQRFGVTVVILEGDLHGDGAAGTELLALNVNGVLVQDGLALVEVADELRDTTGIEEFCDFFGVFALVSQGDLQALVEEGEFAEALRQGVEVVVRRLHDGEVRLEGNAGTGFFTGFAGRCEGSHGDSLFIVLFPGEGIFFTLRSTPDFDVEFLRQSVDATDAHAVETTGYFVAVGVEFSTGVELGENHLSGGDTLFSVDIDRDPPTIVRYGDGVINVDDDLNFGTVASEGLVYGVIDDLVHEVVQSRFAGGADVHGRAQPDGFEAFQNFDRTGIIYIGVLIFTGHICCRFLALHFTDVDTNLIRT